MQSTRPARLDGSDVEVKAQSLASTTVATTGDAKGAGNKRKQSGAQPGAKGGRMDYSDMDPSEAAVQQMLRDAHA